MLQTIYIFIGIALLYGGGEALVHGAKRGVLRLGMTPLVAGLTVVSFATSTPEAAASFYAQLHQHAGNIALGNVIGSNIANVGLILGIAALVRPIRVHKWMRMREMPLMLISLLILVDFMLTNQLGRLGGAIMLFLLVGYIVAQVYIGRKEHSTDPASVVLPKSPKLFALDGFWIVLGGIGLVAGGYFLVTGASSIAQKLGIPPRIIGLTVVAIGTSLPELATTVVAAAKRHADIAMGNVVGSNVFNALFIAGGVSLLSPISFSKKLLMIDAPVMLGFSFLLWLLVFLHKHTLGRLSGALLLVCYIAYVSLAFVYSSA